MRHRTFHPRNRGATLVISLIFLLVLGLLGLAAARVSMMQERMAGNVRETNQAFQSAEATLREIEQRLVAIAQGSTGGLGVIPLWPEMSLNRNDCTLEAKSRDAWSAWRTAPWQSAPETGNDYLVISMPSVLEYGGELTQPPCVPMNASPDTPADDYYLIVARATGPSGTGEVIVQSIFYWPR